MAPCLGSWGTPRKSRKVKNLATQVDTLSDEVAQIKALLQNLQPAQGVPAAAPAAAQPTYTEDDMLSTAASCSLFAEEEEQASLALRRSLKGLWAARLEGQCPAATLLDQPCEWPWQGWGWMKLLFHLHL